MFSDWISISLMKINGLLLWSFSKLGDRMVQNFLGECLSVCYTVSFKTFLLIIWEFHTMYFDHIHFSLLPVTPPRSTPPFYRPNFVSSSLWLITPTRPTYSLVSGYQLERVTPTRDHTREETHSLFFLDAISCPQLLRNYRGLWTFSLFVLECWPAWSCAGPVHSCWKVMSAVALSCLEDTATLQSDPASGSYRLSVPSSLVVPVLWRGCVTDSSLWAHAPADTLGDVTRSPYTQEAKDGFVLKYLLSLSRWFHRIKAQISGSVIKR